MTVRARYQIDDKQVDEMEMSITITMQVREWRQLNDRITKSEAANLYETRALTGAVTAALMSVNDATRKSYSYPRE